MEERILLSGESQILKIGVSTTQQQKIHIIVSDADQINTVLTDRFNVVNGIQYFFVRMPLAPIVAKVQVFNEASGPSKNNDQFQMVGGRGLWRMTLERKMVVIDISNPDVRSFIDYAQRFVYNCGHLKPGDYISADGRIHFRYMATISEGGKELNTPAQTGEVTGEIEISQKKFQAFTVPMRMAILCHEFAHYYLNKNMYDEVEADMQGINMYLALGYPHYEAYEAFLETFKGAPTDLNVERAKKLKWLIDNFANQKTVPLYTDHSKRA